MKRRLFIAINLPENVKNEIEKEIEKIQYAFTNDIRFLDRRNWHITITFLGYQDDESIVPIVGSLKQIGKEFESFRIHLTDISYGPKDKTPRMIWLNGSEETAKILSRLKERLENVLTDNGVTFKKERRRLSAHITLARFVGARGLPKIDTPLALSFPAQSLDLMESHLSRQGADYELLQSFTFKL